jgi:8-oxo-dGTP diphosphatase
MIEKAVASAILYNQHDQVLLQLRDDKPNLRYPNCWTLFGGALEEGETPHTAIRRELIEELELRVPLTFWKVFRCPVRSIENEVTTYNHIFVGRITYAVADLTLHEGQAMRYFSRRKAAELQLAFDQHLILNDWINTYDHTHSH